MALPSNLAMGTGLSFTSMTDLGISRGFYLQFNIMDKSLLALSYYIHGIPYPPVEFQYPACYISKKITVMGYCNDSARIVLKVMLKPCHTIEDSPLRMKYM